MERGVCGPRQPEARAARQFDGRRGVSSPALASLPVFLRLYLFFSKNNETGSTEIMSQNVFHKQFLLAVVDGSDDADDGEVRGAGPGTGRPGMGPEQACSIPAGYSLCCSHRFQYPHNPPIDVLTCVFLEGLSSPLKTHLTHEHKPKPTTAFAQHVNAMYIFFLGAQHANIQIVQDIDLRPSAC